MARSKHTRPLAVRAAERTRRPRASRGADDPASSRAARRRLKGTGVVPQDDAPRPEPDWLLPRILQRPPRPGCSHPASKRDVAAALRLLGEECVYGVRAIELRQGAGDRHRLGRLHAPGRIVLYDQPPSPWRLGRLGAGAAARLLRAGAEVEERRGAVLVRWRLHDLRDFMLFEVLCHELGHHRLQHHKGKRTARIARTRDHEAFARRFAERCRARLRGQA